MKFGSLGNHVTGESNFEEIAALRSQTMLAAEKIFQENFAVGSTTMKSRPALTGVQLQWHKVMIRPASSQV